MTLAALMTLVLVSGQDTKIEDYIPAGIKDLTLTAKIVKGDQVELKKINKDFGASYRFEKTTLSFKPPFKMRAESKVEDTSVVYIVNGTDMIMKLGSLKSKQNLANRPGRRQTTLETGVLTADLFGSLYTAQFIEDDKATGTAVFDLTYGNGDVDKSRSRVWLDRTKKYIVRREWFNQQGVQLATFEYSAPQPFGDVWIPTHMEVKNGEGHLAGVTDYVDIKLNSGLDDALFEIK